MSTDDSDPENLTFFSVMSIVIGALVNESMPRWKPANAIGSSTSTSDRDASEECSHDSECVR